MMDLLGLGFKASILASARSQVKGLRANVSRGTQVRSADLPVQLIRFGQAALAATGGRP
jgi:hypothetical protein